MQAALTAVCNIYSGYHKIVCPTNSKLLRRLFAMFTEHTHAEWTPLFQPQTNKSCFSSVIKTDYCFSPSKVNRSGQFSDVATPQSKVLRRVAESNLSRHCHTTFPKRLMEFTGNHKQKPVILSARRKLFMQTQCCFFSAAANRSRPPSLFFPTEIIISRTKRNDSLITPGRK